MSYTWKLAVLLLVSGPATAGANKQCMDNYTQTGSFFAGRTFSSWYDVPDETPAVAYKNAYMSIAKSGLKIVNADKDMGIITSEMATIGGDGSAATLDFSTVIEKSGKGSKITMTIKSPPNKALGKEGVQKTICGA